MNKSCDNCYWTYMSPVPKFCGYNDTRPEENICENHDVGCEHCKWVSYTAVAKYQFKGEQYCEDCMANKIGIEQREYTVTQYFDSCGDYLGDSNSMDLEDVFLKDSMIECLDSE
jgi:hypothetical protein